MLDQLIYDRNSIVISHAVARFGYTTYAIRAIRSIRIDPPKPKTAIAMIGAIFSLIAVLCALELGVELYKRRMLTFEDEEFGAMLLALALIGSALVWASSHRGPHELVLRTFGGDVVAYASKDYQQLLEIERALARAVGLNSGRDLFPHAQAGGGRIAGKANGGIG
jgi:hypothetical protein